MLTLRTCHLTRLGATRVGVTTRADCGQSTLAFQAVFFFLFVFALPRNSLGNGLCSFGAAKLEICRSCLDPTIVCVGFFEGGRRAQQPTLPEGYAASTRPWNTR